MAIDIDRLTEAELIDLNRRIVERLRFLQQMRAHASMLQFSLGDRVTFDTDDGRRIVGTLMRYNKKSVTVFTNDQHRWNMSPSFRAVPNPATSPHRLRAPPLPRQKVSGQRSRRPKYQDRSMRVCSALRIWLKITSRDQVFCGIAR